MDDPIREGYATLCCRDCGFPQLSLWATEHLLPLTSLSQFTNRLDRLGRRRLPCTRQAVQGQPDKQPECWQANDNIQEAADKRGTATTVLEGCPDAHNRIRLCYCSNPMSSSFAVSIV